MNESVSRFLGLLSTWRVLHIALIASDLLSFLLFFTSAGAVFGGAMFKVGKRRIDCHTVVFGGAMFKARKRRRIDCHSANTKRRHNQQKYIVTKRRHNQPE